MDNCWEIYRNVITETGSSSQEVTVNTIQDGLNSADCFVYFSSIGANWLWEERYLKSKQTLGFIHNNKKKKQDVSCVWKIRNNIRGLIFSNRIKCISFLKKVWHFVTSKSTRLNLISWIGNILRYFDIKRFR